jgi:hypothetical protein
MGGRIEINENACSDSRRFHNCVVWLNGFRRNFAGATGLHRRCIPGLLVGDTES